MGILIKKRQTGGSIFADPNRLVLNADTPTQQYNTAQPKGNYGTASKKTSSSTKKAKSVIDGNLPSDIKFYKQEEARIMKAISEGFATNKDFDSTPAYEMLLQDQYELSVKAPQLKSMNSLYEAGAKKFSSNAAGDAPAIVNNKAIVQIIDREDEEAGTYKTVPVTELLVNAKKYRLLQGHEVLNQRRSNAEFSGFTNLGLYADQIISTAYGSKNYNKDLDNDLEKVGYVKTKGGYKNIKGNKTLNLDNLTFDETSKLITKSNYSNILAVYQALANEGNTNLNTYLEHKSIAFLHNKIAAGKIKLDDKKNTIPNLLGKSISTQLAMKLKANVIIDENEEIKSKTPTKTTKPKGSTKDRHGNIFMDAAQDLLMNTARITIDNVDAKDSTVTDVINVLPAAYISDGLAYLEYGYGKNTFGDETDDVTEFNRKTIQNNSVIQDMMGGQSDITIYNGTTLKSLTDNKNLHNAIIPPGANLHMILAPTIKNDQGKIVVDFTNKFVPKVMEAIAETYKMLKKQDISEADLAKGDIALLQKAQDLAQENFAKIVRGNAANIPIIRATFALDVQYESDGDSVDNKAAGVEVDDTVLHSIIDANDRGVWGTNYAKGTKAFIPISTSFWKKMFKQGSFPTRFENKISAHLHDGARRSVPVVNLLDISGIAGVIANKQHKKKLGGKLASTEDIKNLLFNE